MPAARGYPGRRAAGVRGPPANAGCRGGSLSATGSDCGVGANRVSKRSTNAALEEGSERLRWTVRNGAPGDRDCGPVAFSQLKVPGITKGPYSVFAYVSGENSGNKFGNCRGLMNLCFAPQRFPTVRRVSRLGKPRMQSEDVPKSGLRIHRFSKECFNAGDSHGGVVEKW
jgi:hypothetical protein